MKKEKLLFSAVLLIKGDNFFNIVFNTWFVMITALWYKLPDSAFLKLEHFDFNIQGLSKLGVESDILFVLYP